MPRILLVDDDLDILETLELSLRDTHEVHVAHDGREALERLLVDSCFDVIVLDLMMPRMSGAELVWALRARGIDVPIILTSAVHDLRERAAHLGATDHVSKPFRLRVLRDKIALIAGSATESSRAAAEASPVSEEVALAPQSALLQRVPRCSRSGIRAARGAWPTNESPPPRSNHGKS